jgi:hypothetical protein
MKSILIRQVLVTFLLITIVCIALLVGSLLIPNSRAAGHATQTGTMLVAPAYQRQVGT